MKRAKTDPVKRFAARVIGRLGEPPAGYSYRLDPGVGSGADLLLYRAAHPDFLAPIPLKDHGHTKGNMDGALVDTVSLRGAVNRMVEWVAERERNVMQWVVANTSPRWHHTLSWDFMQVTVSSWQLIARL